jgi:hypothetical protein
MADTDGSTSSEARRASGDGAASSSTPGSSDEQQQEGIVIEVSDNNDICINATHLTVKCDNSFLVTGGSSGNASALAKRKAAPGKSSVVVVQQLAEASKPTRRLPSPSALTPLCG